MFAKRATLSTKLWCIFIGSKKLLCNVIKRIILFILYSYRIYLEFLYFYLFFFKQILSIQSKIETKLKSK